MRLGASFIAFSGLELLKPALLNVREHAVWINVVYQTVSHTGVPAPGYLQDLLSDLKREGLADRWILFQPTARATTPDVFQSFQRMKLELGREDCRQAGCTHVTLRACDEFYFPDQFRWALGESAGLDAAYVASVDYVRLPLIRHREISSLCLPFVHRAELPLGEARLPFRVDPARVVGGARDLKLLPSHRVVMHHMSRVRFDQEEVDRKYESHSWSYAKSHLLLEKAAEREELDPSRYLWMERDPFGILDYWEKEFRSYKHCEGELPALKMGEFDG